MNIKNTGIVRNLATGNRCTIPIEITNIWGIGPGDPLHYSIYDDGTVSGVLISPYRATCTFCGETEDLTDFKRQKVCQKCRSAITQK